MKNEINDSMATKPIGKLMLSYSVPCILSLLAGALYNIVDQIFIANTPELGSFGNAANAVVFPLTIVALALAVMIGDGCCAFVSLSFGKNEPAKASHSTGSAITATIVVSLILCAIYLIFPDPILSSFGGRVNDQTFALCEEYFFWISLGIPFYMFGQAMNPIIRAYGSPAFAMAASLSGAVVNVILDPIFLFVFHWGMMGAAVATVLGLILTFALSLWSLHHLKQIRLSGKDLLVDFPVLMRALSLGTCSFLSQISLVAATAALNKMIQIYGAQDPIFSNPEYEQIPMAVVGIVMKFFQIVISIVVGMAVGCVPVAGFNMGAGLYNRVKDLFIRLLLLEALTGLVGFILVEFCPVYILDLFGASNESVYYMQFGIRCFRIFLCMIILACGNKACFIFLQAMGKAMESTMLSLVRELIFGVDFALLLLRFFGLDGVLYSMPLSDLLTFFISAILIVRTLKTLTHLEKEKEPQKPLQEVQAAA